MTGSGDQQPEARDPPAADLAQNPGVIATTLLSGVIAVAVAAAEWVGSGKALDSPAGILWAVVALLGVVAMLVGFGLELRRRRQLERQPPTAGPPGRSGPLPRRGGGTGLPAGTVTFLFTDIEGSTRLLQELGDRYRAVRDEHAAILRRAIRDGGGVEVSTEGDSFFAAFPSPVAASGPPWPPSGDWPPTRGPRDSRCGSGWACTPGRGSWAGTTTSAST